MYCAPSHHLHHLLKRSSFLTADREEKLNSLGFVWSVRGETGIENMEPAAPAEDVKPAVAVAVAEPMPTEAAPIKAEEIVASEV